MITRQGTDWQRTDDDKGQGKTKRTIGSYGCWQHPFHLGPLPKNLFPLFYKPCSKPGVMVSCQSGYFNDLIMPVVNATDAARKLPTEIWPIKQHSLYRTDPAKKLALCHSWSSGPLASLPLSPIWAGWCSISPGDTLVTDGRNPFHTRN